MSRWLGKICCLILASTGSYGPLRLRRLARIIGHHDLWIVEVRVRWTANVPCTYLRFYLWSPDEASTYFALTTFILYRLRAHSAQIQSERNILRISTQD